MSSEDAKRFDLGSEDGQQMELSEVLGCRTLPREVARRLEATAGGQNGRVSVDTLVEIIVTSHNSGGNRAVLRRSVFGFTVATVCLSAVVCGLVFGSVHLTSQMKVNNSVLYERSNPDVPMHAGATKVVYDATSLQSLQTASGRRSTPQTRRKLLSSIQDPYTESDKDTLAFRSDLMGTKLRSLRTLLFTDKDGTLHMYQTASVSLLPDGNFDVVAISGEKFMITANGVFMVNSVSSDATSGGRRLLQDEGSGESIFTDFLVVADALLSTLDSSNTVDASSKQPKKLHGDVCHCDDGCYSGFCGYSAVGTAANAVKEMTQFPSLAYYCDDPPAEFAGPEKKCKGMIYCGDCYSGLYREF
ncbi:hypothetical protein PSENEW3n2_00003720 [Picochlorum sp. SENEW3]|nr:hypothetical protein PSENEW3n2_00003720 [Picochlorum sp. SENEW3]WPT18420.1 hypothetical protein PSENEW3_00003720 [Picochlorum sp. SENEW3]